MKIAILTFVCLGGLQLVWATYRFFKRPSGKIEPGARWTMVACAVCSVIQIRDLLHEEIVSETHWAIAVALFLTSEFLFWSAVLAHGSRPPSLAYSRDLPENLVTRGPYAVVRHPFYTSYLCGWFALYVVTGKLTSLGAALIMVPFFEYAARSEERKFADTDFGAAYARYVMRTGRFFPNPWKLLRSSAGVSRLG